MTNKYLIKIAQLEKQASILEAGLVHLGQNQITKALLNKSKVGQHIANGFATGVAGVKPTGFVEKAKKFVSGIVSPEIDVMRQKAHSAGIEMSKHMLDNRAKVGLRLLSKGNIPQLQKLRLHEHPAVVHGAKLMDKHMGTSMSSLIKDKQKAKTVHELFKNVNHPLLSNISSRLSKGKLPSKVTQGTEGAGHAITGAITSGGLDPAMGVFNTAKAVMGSKAVQNNKVGKYISDKLEHAFIKTPAKAGYERGSAKTKIDKVKDWAYENGVNSVSGSIKKTTSAFKDIESS